MTQKMVKKRVASSSQGPSKKRKLSTTHGEETKKKAKSKGKDRLADRGIIPIPVRDDDEVELSDQDIEFFEEHGGAAGFLKSLDEKGISRSKKETERLRELHKPKRAPVKDDLPSIDSDSDENEGGGDSFGSALDDEDISDLDDVDTDDDESSQLNAAPVRRKPKPSVEDEEMPYEVLPRKRRPSWDSDSDKDKGIERLPIKLADGRIRKTKEKVILPEEDKEETEQSESESEPQHESHQVEDVSTGARFGRPAVVDVIGNKSRKARIQGAKEQIAGICQEIVADPENSLGLLRRLHTFSLTEITTPSHPTPVPNDPIIRKLTILSQLAVFKDIIPGYRIRALTDKEKAEKVSQMVQRTRDYEQGLVSVYQSYLRTLEAEIKVKSELAEIALQCMCTLLVEVTHFNFRTNLLSSIIANLSRKSWDKSSDLCLNTLIKVFRADLTGVPSLEAVRLLNRMIKERRFNVHPDVLSCLAYLRLKSELGVRASDSKADKHDGQEGKQYSKGRAAARRAKGKSTDQPHLSKKAKKTMKERQEIEKEMREAAAEVDKDERIANHTETLKLLFVLYFRVLKNPHPTPLLPAALQGISKFAHLVNIDFFKDLMKVLKDLMARELPDSSDQPTNPSTEDIKLVQHQLSCIVTAFELLSGQGEALDIDLSEFINRLYGILPILCFLPEIETVPSTSFKSDILVTKETTTADMLFRALHLAFSPSSSSSNSTASPPWRSAAFSKRLLTASLQWPPNTAIRALNFIGELVERDSKLEALFSTEDRSVNGVYYHDVDDPQLCNPFGTSFWELGYLDRFHWDGGVRKAARRLLELGSSSPSASSK
ncbi:nucleolar complex-associated protein 3 [Abortiporus biennis]|nr:nucleolar complex-associated protein 3 [Abortiporus biennis]